VRVGSTIPELTILVDTVHIFMFSAITWNRHLIHYDLGQAQHEGHQSIVAQRGLLGNYFARQLAGWLGDDGGEIAALSWKVVRSAIPGDSLTCRGEIVSVDGAQAAVTLEMNNQDGVLVASGSATVRLAGDRGEGQS
jgi:hydroxyacyl-ACP dehydratase HTD2-like protein with hotdog domain